MERMRCCSASLGVRQSHGHIPSQRPIASPEVLSANQRLGRLSFQHYPVSQQQWKGVGVSLQRAMQVAASSARCRHMVPSAGNGVLPVASAAAARRSANSSVAAVAAAGGSGSGCETATRKSPNRQVHTKQEEEDTHGTSALNLND